MVKAVHKNLLIDPSEIKQQLAELHSPDEAILNARAMVILDKST